MRISTATERIDDVFGKEEAIRMIAQAGFDCADLSMFDMEEGYDSPFLQDNYVEYALHLKQIAEEWGICFNQAHAPFSMDMRVWETDAEAWEDVLFRIRRAIEIAGIVGAPRIVVHPVQYMIYWNTDPEYMLNKNREFYRLLTDTARKAGVKICVENMWRMDLDSKIIRDSVCASPYEFARYVDTFNQDADIFCACLDIGHCVITSHDPANAVRVLGDRLEALHVHDTNFFRDLHTCPLTGNIDQYKVMEALAEIGYQGDFTLEAASFLRPFRKEFYQEALNFMAKVSRHLADIAAN